MRHRQRRRALGNSRLVHCVRKSDLPADNNSAYLRLWEVRKRLNAGILQLVRLVEAEASHAAAQRKR
jgi:hypothetical protein